MITNKLAVTDALNRRNSDFSGVISQENINRGPFARAVIEASNRSFFSSDSVFRDLRSLTDGVSFFLNRVSTVMTENPGLSLFVGSVVLGRALFGSRKQKQGSVTPGEGILQESSMKKNQGGEPEKLSGGHYRDIETFYSNSEKRIGGRDGVKEEDGPGLGLDLTVKKDPERCNTPFVSMTIKDEKKSEEETETDTFQGNNRIGSPDRKTGAGNETPETEHPKQEELYTKGTTDVSQKGSIYPLGRPGSLPKGNNFDSPILNRPGSQIADTIRKLRKEKETDK